MNNNTEQMSRQDIIDMHSPHGEYDHYYHEHAILEMLSDYSKQVSIDFAIFCSNKGEGHNGSWRGNVMAGEGVWTTEQLFTEFNKQYNQ